MMASLNQRDAGRDFEGNGPSSFDEREYRIEPSDYAGPSEETIRICDEAVAHVAAAFDAARDRYYAGQAKRVAA